MARYIVTTVHDCGCGEVEVEASSPVEAKRLAREQAQRLGTDGLFRVGAVRKVGDKHLARMR